LKVRDATRHVPVQLPAHATIGDAARLMDKEAVGAVVIKDSEHDLPIGVVTDRDLVVRAVGRDLPTDARIDSVMSMGVICVDADADVHDAARLFAVHPIRRLPVVSGTELIGMLTVDDLLVDLSDELARILRGVTAQVLFGHPEPKPSMPVTT
jgi:signal-transduction protein with cAMP-binding, CBS, and nucleotidyltransferase domain